MSFCRWKRTLRLRAVSSHRQTSAAVDRAEEGKLELHSTACLEFAENAGLWCLATFADAAGEAEWSGLVKRLPPARGYGGGRQAFAGLGAFGATGIPRSVGAGLIRLLPIAAAYWLLSVYTPAEDDPVDWKRGDYSLITRGGRIESPAQWGGEKQLVRMLEEGSVIFADSAPKGAARNVAPDGFPHPVYRSGIAMAIPIPWKGSSAKARIAEPVPEPKNPETAPASFEYEPIAVESGAGRY